MRIAGLGRLVALVLMLASAGITTPAWAENKLAFVVGINAYPKLPATVQLTHAVNDATALGATMSGLGFKVTTVTDPGVQELLSKFDTFLATITPGDTVLFYFAGHGMSLDDGTYLIPGDVAPLGPNDQLLARRSSLSVREVSDGIASHGGRVVIVVIDACRDNPFPKSGTRAIGSATRGLARLDVPQGVFTLYSARERQTALDGLSDGDINPNSVFTRTLIKYIKTPGLSLPDVGERVRDDVAKLTRSVGQDQVPSVSNDLVDARNVFLAGSTPSSGPQAPSSDPYCARRAAYDIVVQSSGIDPVRHYVQQCGDGAFAGVAQQEFESRLFASANECMRRSSGCDLGGCIRIYETDLPDGLRLSALRAQAQTLVASRAVCKAPADDPTPSSTPNTVASLGSDEPSTRSAQPDPPSPPRWCRSSRLNAVESTICAEPELWSLDAGLNTSYQSRLDALSSPERAQLEREENGWRSRRDRKCGSGPSTAMKSCLVLILKDRIAALSGTSETPFVPPAWCRSSRLLPIEVAICSDARLSAMDGELTEAFNRRLQMRTGASRTNLLNGERAWVQERNRQCSGLSGEALTACAIRLTQQRITVLRQ